MKFQSSDPLPGGKTQTRSRRTSKLAPLVALIVLLTIPLYYPSIRDSTKKLSQPATPAAFQSLEDPIKPETSRLEENINSKESTDEKISDPVVDRHEEEEELRSVEKIVNNLLPDELIHSISQSSQSTRESTHTTEELKHLADNKLPLHGDHPAAWHKKRHDKGRRKKPPGQPQTENDHNPINENTITSRTQDVINNNQVKSKKDSNRASRYIERAMIRSRLLEGDRCDLFTGEWVPNPKGPYYTNDTCETIQEHQNCLKFGRPDRGFLKWKWKPDDCELQLFNPREFLELVRGKSLAFVGDSVARNHMQSLLCL